MSIINLICLLTEVNLDPNPNKSNPCKLVNGAYDYTCAHVQAFFTRQRLKNI